MIVLHKNKFWELDMPFLLFESVKALKPNTSVTITEITQSSYKYQRKIKIIELEDYSVARNLQALMN